MKINIKHIAKLANLNIPKEHEEKFRKQLEEILSYIEKLNKADTKNVETTSQVTGLENVSREDKASPSLKQEEALSNSRSTHNGLFKVDAIFDNE